MEFLQKLLPFSGMITMLVVWGILIPMQNKSSNRRIWGNYIDDKYAVHFLNQYLEEYELLDMPGVLYHPRNINMPFIKKQRGIFSAYYIQDIGRIRRRSQAAKMIDNKFLRLIYHV